MNNTVAKEMESRNVNILVHQVVVGKEEYISFRDLLTLYVRKKIYVKTRKGMQGNKHYLLTNNTVTYHSEKKIPGRNSSYLPIGRFWEYNFNNFK